MFGSIAEGHLDDVQLILVALEVIEYSRQFERALDAFS